jgi:hypothetical protein
MIGYDQKMKTLLRNLFSFCQSQGLKRVKNFFVFEKFLLYGKAHGRYEYSR